MIVRSGGLSFGRRERLFRAKNIPFWKYRMMRMKYMSIQSMPLCKTHHEDDGGQQIERIFGSSLLGKWGKQFRIGDFRFVIYESCLMLLCIGVVN